MTGAGGTDGGIGKFILGLAMFVAGVYLMLNSIYVQNDFSMGYSIFEWDPFRLHPDLS